MPSAISKQKHKCSLKDVVLCSKDQNIYTAKCLSRYVSLFSQGLRVSPSISYFDLHKSLAPLFSQVGKASGLLGDVGQMDMIKTVKLMGVVAIT